MMIGGFLYTILFVAAIAPGLPLGFALFGRRHPAGWIAGALLGYGLTQLTLWAAIESGLASPFGFAFAWCVLLLMMFAIGRAAGPEPAVPIAQWSGADLRALILVLLLVPVLMGVPYRNLGRADAEGNRYYRAYFTADFVWHSALAYELGRFSLPPTNPYLAPRRMNYYWTYFLLPAAVAELAPASLRQLHDVERCLKANALLIGVLMMASLFLLVRSAVSSPWPAAAAVALAVTAASAEGLYAIVDLVWRGRPLSGLTDLNVDAVTAWAPFNGLRIDNIPRSLWYTPQHTTSIGLGLIGLFIASAAGAAASTRAIVGAGLALALATTMNPLLGGVCSIIYGVGVVIDATGHREAARRIVRHLLAAVPVLLAVAWGWASSVMEGAGSALAIGFHGFSRSPVVTLALSLGPVLAPALLGTHRPGTAKRAVTIGTTGIIVGLFLLYCVRISEASWVGFRAGQILLVSIPILLARTIERLTGGARIALVALILFLGLPTTLADTYNAQDISNRRPGPGFRWTLWTTPAQQAAFAWIRDHTDPRAIVQMEPIVRGREHWTLIPSFAGRRMAAGLPISLLPQPEYNQRSEMVRHIFATPDVRDASTLARKMRLDYLYVDPQDVAAYPAGVAKFDREPSLFERVFDNGTVRVYRVL